MHWPAALALPIFAAVSRTRPLHKCNTSSTSGRCRAPIALALVAAAARAPMHAAGRSGALRGARASVHSSSLAPGPISLHLVEPGGVVEGGSTLRRTVTLQGVRAGSEPITVDWEARLNGVVAAGGRDVVAARDGAPMVEVTVQLPALDRPAGLDLKVEAHAAGTAAGAASFPFLVYPKDAGGALAQLLERAHVALYDPEGSATPALAALGLHAEAVGAFEELAGYRGGLIIVGPGGFSRGREALGPILAERARAGARILLLEQPSLPGTFSADLRLWPAFARPSDTGTLVAAGHPVLRGLTADGAAAYFAAGAPSVRPLLPPTRGNFRIISEVRARTGPGWQEGVTLLELPIGSGTLLAAQSSLCADFAVRPQARLVLANALAYLLGQGRALKRAFLYGDTLEDLPACLARLEPDAPRLPGGFTGVDVLLVAGDWRAPRVAAASRLPPPAEVARYLREGGTVLLVNPQPLSLAYLNTVVGAPVYFDPSGETDPPPGSSLLEGVADDDLGLLGGGPQAGLRLRSLPGGVKVEAVLIARRIAQYRVGQGTLVALSLPDAADCAAPRTSSLLSRLLTNLGVPLARPDGIDADASSLDD